MGNDNELFDEQIDEDEDLLNFDLDDLTPEDSDEDLLNDDEEIIELTDRIELEEEYPSDDEDDNITAEIIRIQKDSEQIDDSAETLTDLDISVLGEEEESVKAEGEAFREDPDGLDISEDDFNKIFEEDESTAETKAIDESENAINELISKINFDDNATDKQDIEDDIITEDDFDDRDLADILEDTPTGEMELERLEGTDDSLLEVIEKAGEDDLADTISNLQMEDKTAVLNLADEGGFTESKGAPEPEAPVGTIPGISESTIEEIISRVLQRSVETVIQKTVAAETEKVVKETVADVTEVVIKETVVEVLERVVRETVATAADKVIRETLIEVVERVVQETVAGTAERVVRETVVDVADKVIRETVIDVVEKAVKETVAEAAERVLSESIEALKQSLEINSD